MKASKKQVGGSHYGKNLQTFDVVDAWGLNFYEGTALKYIERHRSKNGAEDIQKAIHYLEVVLEKEYSVLSKEEQKQIEDARLKVALKKNKKRNKKKVK